MDITDRKAKMARSLKPTGQFSGKFLIASPTMGSDYFDRSVIFICAHSAEGAMGFQINKPSQVSVSELMQASGSAGLQTGDQATNYGAASVLTGGPVDEHRGFVLHSSDFKADETQEIGSDISLTANVDVLTAIAAGRGPEKKALFLGYSGWGDGQLEQEIADNAWLVAQSSAAIIFDQNHEMKYDQILGQLGIKAENLVAYSGQA